MNFLQKIRFWKVISASVVLLLCTSIFGIPVSPYRQFLEVINYSSEIVTISLRSRREEDIHTFVRFEVTVAPGGRQRIPDAFVPDMQNLAFSIGSSIIETKRFQVNDYGIRTFLHGKQLTIGKRGDYNVKPVRFFHGIWRIKKLDPKAGWLEWELNFSHVHQKVKGSITEIKTGEKTIITGALSDDIWTFNIALAASTQVNGQLRVTADGTWKGNIKANYMEDGKRKSTVIPLEFEVDFQKKILVFKE